MKLIKKICLIMFVVFLINFIVGCVNKPKPVENKIKFSTYTQEERKEYIKKYLSNNYNLKCSEISDVKQRQLTAIHNEENYFSIVDTDDGERIFVWVSKDGQVTDTYFLVEMSDLLSNHFTTKVNKIIPKCKVKTYTVMRDIPTIKLSRNDDIETYLYSQPAYTYIDVFVDNDVTINDNLVNELEAALNYCDASLYIYVCDDIENIDSHTHDCMSYVYQRFVKKGN